ncbi:MAG: hypothetical protein RJA87_929 [Pseudomonadota bacterium]|jgi:hypothetical protein
MLINRLVWAGMAKSSNLLLFARSFLPSPAILTLRLGGF